MTDAAYRELEARHQGLLRTAIKNVWIAGEEYDDLLQECRLALWRAGERYDPDKGVTLASFVWREAQQRIGHLRASANGLTRQMHLGALSLDDPDVRATPAAPDPGFGRAILREYLRTLMETLNDRERVVALHLAEGHDWERPARALGVSIRAVQMLWFYARRKMAAVARGDRPPGKPIRRKPSSTWRRMPQPVRSIETGRVYPSAAAASREQGLQRDAVAHALKAGHRAGGQHWEIVPASEGGRLCER
jgi:RNA polymerase sigma factor (sigma-70 family)